MKLNLTMPTETVKSTLGFEIKPFLTADEIRNIAESMLEEDNFMNREIIKGVLLVEFCTDIEVPYDENGDIEKETYDLYKTNGIIDEIENTINEKDLFLIDEYIMYEESMSRIIKTFCDNVSEKVNNFDINEVINELSKQK